MTDQKHQSHLQTHFPRMRRHTVNGLDTFMKQAIGQSFLTFMNIPRKPTFKQSQQMIISHLQQINSIINTVDEHIAKRLQTHEAEVFSIVKNEMEEMKATTSRLVNQLNQKISQNRTEDQIYNLQNQLDYFKCQTFKLFQQNNQFRKDIQELKAKIKMHQIQIQNNEAVMQKMKKKLIKEKIMKDKERGLTPIPQIGIKKIGNNLKQFKGLNGKPKNQTERTRRRQYTQIGQYQQRQLISNQPEQKNQNEQSLVRLNLNNLSDKKNDKSDWSNREGCKIKDSERVSVPSLSLHRGSYDDDELDSQMPELKLAQIQSFQIPERQSKYSENSVNLRDSHILDTPVLKVGRVTRRNKMVDKQVQTDLINNSSLFSLAKREMMASDFIQKSNMLKSQRYPESKNMQNSGQSVKNSIFKSYNIKPFKRDRVKGKSYRLVTEGDNNISNLQYMSNAFNKNRLPDAAQDGVIIKKSSNNRHSTLK